MDLRKRQTTLERKRQKETVTMADIVVPGSASEPPPLLRRREVQAAVSTRADVEGTKNPAQVGTDAGE